jgi:glycosyltransferase involved in cell wall biosynthesis
MLEFMACGVPVVLGVDGQARSILEEAQGGIFVEPDDPKQLADAIARLRADPQLREELGRNGRRYIVNHMSRERSAAQYLSILKTLVQE